MAVVKTISRATGAIRNPLEGSVRGDHGLRWRGWGVLGVVWFWEEIEARHVASEAGISKGTLTGVLTTLEGRGLLLRRTHPDDARRVLVALTDRGHSLMGELFPEFNAQEVAVTAPLESQERLRLA